MHIHKYTTNIDFFIYIKKIKAAQSLQSSLTLLRVPWYIKVTPGSVFSLLLM